MALDLTFQFACGILFHCPGGSGAAEAREPRQVRKEAAISGIFRVPPGRLPGHF